MQASSDFPLGWGVVGGGCVKMHWKWRHAWRRRTDLWDLSLLPPKVKSRWWQVCAAAIYLLTESPNTWEIYITGGREKFRKSRDSHWYPAFLCRVLSNHFICHNFLWGRHNVVGENKSQPKRNQSPASWTASRFSFQRSRWMEAYLEVLCRKPPVEDRDRRAYIHHKSQEVWHPY